ncbi:hypothetical protein [Flavobacterium pectinovorum]|uniref:Uncharacterized protein n=1 Tax=Flavobacterium pectinovorum TaxID=29533 RepID=A0A502F4D3_9FLAO|nr:hypothetical protein [Flavobacterium pectinovorum]TPG44094.1 hypothetical protein EAH81_05980 [Flavobacterium pectinovorum]
MRNFKFIIPVVLFFFAFLSREYKSRQRVLAGLEMQQVYSKFQILHVIDSGSFAANKTDLHIKVKKKVKYRATTSDPFILKRAYSHQLIRFGIFKNSLIYGIAKLYQVDRHAHLHLYQLF